MLGQGAGALLSAGGRVQEPYWVMGPGCKSPTGCLGQGAGALLSAGAGCRGSGTATVFPLSAHCGHLVCMVSPRLAPYTKFPSIVVFIHQNLSLILLRLLLRLEFQDAYKHASGLTI